MIADELMAPEVYSILVTLQPLKESVIPAAHGHWAYSLFLKLLSASNPCQTDELHSLDGLKPFTVSTLQGKLGRVKDVVRLNPEKEHSLRLTFLNGEVFSHFLDAAMRWGGKALELGPASFRIENIRTIMTNEPGVSFDSYQGLLDKAVAERSIELEFLSPTAFRSGGKRNVIFPQPELVFGSYLSKWQEFSPVKLDDSISLWLDKTIVTRYKLETRILDFGSYQEVGFIGRCRFEPDRDTSEEAVVALNTLADFAFYCGTGAKTTMGMGQTRRVK